MTDLDEMFSLYASLGVSQGFTDILAILKNNPRETDFDFDVNSIRVQDVIPAKSFNLSISQTSNHQSRFAGEGAESSTIQVGIRKSRATAVLPIFAPPEGWVDPVVALMWDLCKQAYWGTATAAMGRLISPTNESFIASGQSEIYTDNIADFVTFVAPFPINIIASSESGEESEIINVVEIVKSERKLILGTTTQYPHSTNETIITFLPSFAGPEREPDFSLMSLREGMLTPCLINKISIEATEVKPSIDLSLEVAYIHNFRKQQIDLRNVRQTLLQNLAKKGIGRLIYGSEISLSSTTPTNGAFGLGVALGNELFGGYQGIDIHPVTVTGVSIVVDNQLSEIYTTHSMANNAATRNDDNNRPFALYSGGRTITGKITYKSSLESWAVLERLAGPSSINNGGLVINFGNFKIIMDEIAWQPSQSSGAAEGDEERVLNWTMLSRNYDSMPRLDYAVKP
jgi:hypothetical protein